MRTPVKNVPDEKTRRGRRKGQAVKSYGMPTARENALVAILGQDFVDHRVELVDCLIAFETCPDRAPKKLDPKLANLAWRMLHALKRGDSAWFRKLLAVREGEAFKRLSARGSVEAIDPLRAILAKLAQLQEDGRCGPVISIDELETFVAQRNGSAVPSDVKALRRAAREVGVKLAFKRGPKSGPRIDHGIN